MLSLAWQGRQPRFSLKTVNWDEGLSDEILERIDAMPDSPLPVDQIVFSDGQSLVNYAAERGITLDVILSADAANTVRHGN
ncbi:MAG: hypothetical protein LM550_11985 [Candidatus Contendobacter sp.]|jgi:hypothetical protein|nr:hypothetical protein [Gammaproteobacteria bacterium]MCC8994379.1 hypothetical protein [Candidatus Contendobacter sp.]